MYSSPRMFNVNQ